MQIANKKNFNEKEFIKKMITLNFLLIWLKSILFNITK